MSEELLTFEVTDVDITRGKRGFIDIKLIGFPITISISPYVAQKLYRGFVEASVISWYNHKCAEERLYQLNIIKKPKGEK